MAIKVYNGSAWVELALKSDVKTYYTHNIRITSGSNHANFTLTTSDSGAYNRTTLYDKMTAMTNSWARPLPVNGYVYDDDWEFFFPLMAIEIIRSGKTINLYITYLGGDGQPAHLTVPVLSYTMNDIVSPAQIKALARVLFSWDLTK